MWSGIKLLPLQSGDIQLHIHGVGTHRLLHKMDVDLFSPPFDPDYQTFLRRYLADVERYKTSPHYRPKPGAPEN